MRGHSVTGMGTVDVVTMKRAVCLDLTNLTISKRVTSGANMLGNETQFSCWDM
jgi:hypothetical protein